MLSWCSLSANDVSSVPAWHVADDLHQQSLSKVKDLQDMDKP